MKQFWVDARPWNKDIVTTAIESGADAIVAETAAEVKTARADHHHCPGRRPCAGKRRH